MTTTEEVSILEDISLRYRVPVQPPEFEISQEEAYFEFNYDRIWEIQEELLGLGAIAIVINFSFDKKKHGLNDLSNKKIINS